MMRIAVTVAYGGVPNAEVGETVANFRVGKSKIGATLQGFQYAEVGPDKVYVEPIGPSIIR
jgi:hypothetical protein